MLLNIRRKPALVQLGSFVLVMGLLGFNSHDAFSQSALPDPVALPAPTPAPTNPSAPVSPQPITPIAATPTPVAAPTPVASPTPVAAPTSPVASSNLEEDLSYAELLFSRDQFALAAQQYQIFVKEKPQSPNVPLAWFRLGECYLKNNQIADADKTFQYLVKTFKKGPFVGSASYRLAVSQFNTKNYPNALAYFQIAKDELNSPEAKMQALFYFARSLQLTQKPEEALAQFEVVAAAKEPNPNPYAERATLELARLHAEMGDPVKALARFETLAQSSATTEIREEAIVRGGLLAAESGQVELSQQRLNEALKFPDTSPWKSLAQVGAIFNAYTQADYDRVIGLYNTGTYSTPDESRSKMLLIVGHSFRIKGDLDSAVRLYSLVESKFPTQPEGVEAGYRKLQILHQQRSESLPEAVDDFVKAQLRANPENNYIDMARLMKAELFFSKAESATGGAGSEYALLNYGKAARAYREVREDKIDAKYHEARLYKQGWAEIESGEAGDGILTLSRFIQQYPASSLASSALAKRASSYQAKKEYQFAIDDYKDIVKRYPDVPEVEYSLQQIALLHAQLRQLPEMVAAYQELLKQYPKTEGAGEAHYWIGVGYFDQEKHAEAIPDLRLAREIDSDFEDKATLRLVICHYQLEQIDDLVVEAERYLESGKTATPAPVVIAPDAPKEGEEGSAKQDPPPAAPTRTAIPPQVLEYLGRTLAVDRKFDKAEYFLAAISTPNEPLKTSATIWKLLGECRMKLKNHPQAIVAYDHYLAQTERPPERATAYLERGLAQLCLKDFTAARSSAQESLRSQKEGRTNAEARILLGDISAADGRLDEAAREYLVVSQIFADPEVTPKALAKAIRAYQALGDITQAQRLTQELSNGYPNYVIPTSLDPEC